MASTGGGNNPGGNNPGGSGHSGSGSKKEKETDPTVPRSGSWQHKPLTEWEWAEEPARVNCVRGDCERDAHVHSGESNYTHEKKKK
ncbi:hypothetical protein N8I77_010176 [Diaporthe amygdali]|uniref:Uncharacterized protein n=1 Tax=Phomopsis amygdali TaxID=1214568 RepID=A0AAD9VYV5_PHOAM|nr:hypothetical protein N8I77_010176 [Diaporthe amygdali]